MKVVEITALLQLLKGIPRQELMLRSSNVVEHQEINAHVIDFFTKNCDDIDLSYCARTVTKLLESDNNECCVCLLAILKTQPKTDDLHKTTISRFARSHQHDTTLRLLALHAMHAAGAVTIFDVFSLLFESNQEVKRLAREILADLTEVSEIKIRGMSARLNDKNSRIRCDALEALRSLKDRAKRQVPAITRVMCDRSEEQQVFR